VVVAVAEQGIVVEYFERENDEKKRMDGWQDKTRAAETHRAQSLK
jgi:hypothetical protein